MLDAPDLFTSYPPPCHETAPGGADRPTPGSIEATYASSNGTAGSTANAKAASPSIFRYQIPPCPTPASRQIVNRHTGAITYQVQIGQNAFTRQTYEKPCRRNGCSSCVVRAARKSAMAIQMTAPTHHLFLTQVGTDYAVINGQMRRFSEVVRKVDPTYAHVWSAEVNPQGTGNHIHGFFHADEADEPEFLEVLPAARQKAGFGNECGFESLPDHTITSYFAYPFKSLVDPEGRDPYLDLNGPAKPRKFVHSSPRRKTCRGFWRDGAGGRSMNQGEAEDLASKRYWERQGVPRLVLSS
jgi:hypothetical protein